MNEIYIRGTIYSFTKIERESAPAGFVGLAPYFVAIVELKENLRLTTRLSDWGKEEPVIGEAVEMTVRRLNDTSDERGTIKYGYAFRQPVEPLMEEKVKQMREEIWKYWDPKLIPKKLGE